MATTTTTTEESSAVSPATVAPQQPDLETNIEPDSAATTEPSEARSEREEKEDEEGEEGGETSAKEQSLDPEWVEERFRIDRKKLETMLYGEVFSLLLSCLSSHSALQATFSTSCSI